MKHVVKRDGAAYGVECWAVNSGRVACCFLVYAFTAVYYKVSEPLKSIRCLHLWVMRAVPCIKLCNCTQQAGHPWTLLDCWLWLRGTREASSFPSSSFLLARANAVLVPVDATSTSFAYYCPQFTQKWGLAL